MMCPTTQPMGMTIPAGVINDPTTRSLICVQSQRLDVSYACLAIRHRGDNIVRSLETIRKLMRIVAPSVVDYLNQVELNHKVLSRVGEFRVSSYMSPTLLVDEVLITILQTSST